MKPSEVLNSNNNRELIRKIIEANDARNPRIFGSVSRGEDKEVSDLDLLVDITENTTYVSFYKISNEVLNSLGIQCDIHTIESISDHFIKNVLKDAVPL